MSGTEYWDHGPAEELILYVFKCILPGQPEMVLILDKLGQEWRELKLDEVKTFTYLGVPVTGIDKGKGIAGEKNESYVHPLFSSSNPYATTDFSFKMPPYATFPEGPKVSFFDTNSIPGGKHGFKREGSTHTHATSGVKATKVPTDPLKPYSTFTPSMSAGFRPGSRASWDSTRSKVKPTNFQKWVKKFNGSGDPYDHLASFKQVARAEQVSDLHTLIEGFGLTLEGKALSWFQTLDPSSYEKFQGLKKGFIIAFTKTRIKHSVSTLVESFKQQEKEMVRDCANRLRQYISCCPEDKLPGQAKLVLLFLEGLLNKALHANWYGRKHKGLNECIADAIDLDDNCDIYGIDKPISGTDASSQTSGNTARSNPTDAEALVGLIMKKMNQVFKPTPRAVEPNRYYK